MPRGLNGDKEHPHSLCLVLRKARRLHRFAPILSICRPARCIKPQDWPSVGREGSMPPGRLRKETMAVLREI